jgi:hypothetical protein
MMRAAEALRVVERLTRKAGEQGDRRTEKALLVAVEALADRAYGDMIVELVEPVEKSCVLAEVVG